MLKRMWREDEGVLTFEWILLTTLLVIGVVGGISGVRDAINVELDRRGRRDHHPGPVVQHLPADYGGCGRRLAEVLLRRWCGG